PCRRWPTPCRRRAASTSRAFPRRRSPTSTRRPTLGDGAPSRPGSLDGVRTDVIRKPTTPARVRVWAGDRLRDRPDRLVTEEPMEIRIDAPDHEQQQLAVVMRTPGNDFEL